jgi:hypothetical protein
MLRVRAKLLGWLKRCKLRLKKSTDKKSGDETRTVDAPSPSNYLNPSRLLQLPTELLFNIIDTLDNGYLADLPRGGDPLSVLRL